MVNKKSKTKHLLVFMLAILIVFTAIFSFTFVNVVSEKRRKEVYSAETAQLSLEGTNSYSTNKTGNITFTLKLKNPERKKIFYIGCHIVYNTEGLTFVSGDKNIAGWGGNIAYITNGGFINIPVSASDSSGQVNDETINVATLTFEVNNPNAQAYPFTFESISVSGMDPTSYRVTTTGETFNLSFHEPSSDASVNSVSVKSGTSEVGTYNEATKTYTATVPFTTSSVNVQVVANDPNARISGNGTFNLTAGQLNTRTVTITAEDRLTTKTVTINVTREAGNSNADIDTITLKNASGTEIALSVSGTTYTANLKGNESTGLTLTATAQEATSIVTIDGGTATNHALTLSSGTNEIEVKVKAQDNTEKIYTVVLNVESLSSNANIGAITLKNASGNEIALTNSGTTYTANITPSESTGLTLTATTEDAKATVTIDGGTPTNHALTLTSGTNEIEIKVKAQDNTEKTYTVVINVASLSSNVNLQSVSIVGGGINYNAVKVDEIYLVQFPNTINSIKVNAVTEDSLTQIVRIDATELNSDVAISSYQPSDNINLTEQTRKLNIVVKAQNGTEATYKLVLLTYQAGGETTEGNIKIGGDFDISISYAEFLSSVDNLIKNVLVEDERVVFYIDATSNFSVNVFYNNDFLDETKESLANGNVRHSFEISKLNTGKNSVILQISDSTSGTSKLYVLNISVKQDDKNVNITNTNSKILIAIIVVGCVMLVIACIVIASAIIKLNRANRLYDKMDD